LGDGVAKMILKILPLGVQQRDEATFDCFSGNRLSTRETPQGVSQVVAVFLVCVASDLLRV
jgi:hypothetical protein